MRCHSCFLAALVALSSVGSAFALPDSSSAVRELAPLMMQVAHKHAHKSYRAPAVLQPQILAPAPVPGVGISGVPVPRPAIPPGATFQDRVFLCTHQAGSFGLTPDQRGAFIHNCAM